MNSGVASASIESAYAACEHFAGRDKPHLYAAAQHFGWPQTRRAFAATYASMRLIDDFVDGIPGRAHLNDRTRATATSRIDEWWDSVRKAKSGMAVADPVWEALSDTFARFELPLEPWDDLARAMRSDLSTPIFRDWEHLRAYMAGASVAPAVVFMHLVLMRPADDRFRSPWPYDKVVAATEDLAIFCYWVHILRDVAADLASPDRGLLYLPEKDLRDFGLDVADLYRMRDEGHASDGYLRLAQFEAERARTHLDRGRGHLRHVLAAAPPAGARALTELVDTYVAVLQGLAQRQFDVFKTASPH
ncbi:MAG: squalene/phytoene synthase family protein [candidate division Zixibacteria bacterium]|nr:squalene/phytoene synthase family protein [candidate division Zixibacteria bacterium]